MNRTCLKCGHANAAATGSELEACPACGAIYSRVEAAAAQRGAQPTRPVRAPQTTPSFAAAPAGLRGTDRDGAFLDQLRAESNYPTFRSVIGVFTLVGYVLAALTAAGAVFSMAKVNIGAGLLGLAVAVFIVIMTRMGKEMSLMVADASDALVRMAARSQ